MAIVFDEQSNASFAGLLLSVKNTFLHVSSEHSEVTSRSRRSSAPDLTWRFESSIALPDCGDNVVSEKTRCSSSPDLMWRDELSSIALPNDDIVSEQTRLVVKNTFLHVAPEHFEVASSRRRTSTPDFTWRLAFSSVALPCDNLVSERSDRNALCTVMMKNIPCSCKKTDVIAAIEESGFMAFSNFFYIPNRRGKILGYAFIGFPSVETTEEFAKAMTGYRFPNKTSTRVVSIVPACIQGMENNLEYFKERSVMQTREKPFFRDS
jgi:hypothetical protein